MAIPDFQSIMLPLMLYASDGKEHSLQEMTDAMADRFHLSDDELKELLPSGQQAVFANRTGWAVSHLKKAGVFTTPRRAYYVLTKRGQDLLAQNHERITMKILKQYPEYIEFIGGKKKSQEKDIKSVSIEDEPDTGNSISPLEIIENEFENLLEQLSNDLLDTIKSCSPSFFEKMVAELLFKMGYGGSRQDAVKAIGKSGDEGVDGIIKEDRLGLDVAYIQAKRWSNSVGRPEIQQFVGALQGQKSRKGIFITTSSFTKEAYDYVSKIDNRVVLIDGKQLAQLMIEHDLGVSPMVTYSIKKIDTDFFAGE